MERIVTAYLDLAESRARNRVVMNMKDWDKFLVQFLELADYPLLKDNGKISMLEAKLKAESEYEKFRIVQDKNYISDFDREIIRNELATYSKNLSHKPEVVFLSKADLLKDEEISKIIKLFNKEKISITPISSNEDDLLLVKKELNKIVNHQSNKSRMVRPAAFLFCQT